MQELTCCALIFYIVVSQVAFITVFNDSSQVSGRVVGARGGAAPAMPGRATARVASEADEEASSEATRALGVSAHASCEATGVLGFHFQGFNVDSPRFPGV